MKMLVKLALSGRCCVEFTDESLCRIQDSIFYLYVFPIFSASYYLHLIQYFC